MTGLSVAEERNKQNADAVKKFKRTDQELTNPCMKEYFQSYNCLDQNGYDQDACEAQFENYKLCKTFWHRVQLDRRIRGITPTLPPPEEREKIKEEYLRRK